MQEKQPKFEDSYFKYIIRKLGIRFHRYMGCEGEKIEFQNIEINTFAGNSLYMDILYEVDDDHYVNIEHQSGPLYEDKMDTIYHYHMGTEWLYGKPVLTVVVSTANPNWGISDTEIKFGIIFKPNLFFLKKKDGRKTLKAITDKVKSNEELTNNEAIDLILITHMKIDMDVRKLLRKTTEILKKAKMSDSKFKLNIMECQSYLLGGFFEKSELQEMREMLNLKPEDYGCEPNTGFEEAMQMTYLEGLRAGHDEDYKKGYNLGHDDGRDEGYDIGRADSIAKTALKMRELGYDIEEISKITDLDSKTIKKL